MIQHLIQQIPFNKLVASPENVRTISASKQADKELLASIEAEGILQNLVVKPDGKKFSVVAGGRRFAALGELVKAGKLPKDYPVPALVSEGKATTLSTLENVMRAAMHPADEFRAFAKMIGEGKPLAEVAKTFGVTQKVVRQRMALGNLSPAILAEYEQNNLDLDDVMAFTLIGDHAKQEACFAALMSSSSLYPHAIRQWLTGESIKDQSPVAVFVGAAAYKKAGGAISADLFSPAEYWNDSALAHALADEKLAKLAEAAKTEGKWAWAVSGVNVDERQFRTIAPAAVEPPAELKAAYIALRDELETAGEAYYGDTMSEAEEAAYLAKCDELGELEAQVQDASQAYTDKQKAVCGIVVTLDAQGRPKVRQGFARAEDMAQIEQSDGEDGSNGLDVHQGAETPDTGRQLSQALLDDLRGYRQEITKAQMLRHDALALDVLRYTVCSQVLYSGYEGSGLLSLRCPQVPTFVPKVGPRGGRAADELAAGLDALAQAWLSSREPAERLQGFLALPEKAKRALTTYCVTQLLQVSTRGVNAAQDAIIAAMGVPFHDYWRPTTETYFSRITKPIMAEQFGVLRGAEWLASLTKAKKADAAAELDTWVQGQPEWVPEQF